MPMSHIDEARHSSRPYSQVEIKKKNLKAWNIQAPGVEPGISAYHIKEDFQMKRRCALHYARWARLKQQFGRRESNPDYPSACLIDEDLQQMKRRCAAHYARFIGLWCKVFFHADFGFLEWNGLKGKVALLMYLRRLNWIGDREVGFNL
ncbi:hypothetical protein K438DRAFT_1777027 [Mycena galopus ATCC 62051]|nr:hypothetical protein K438DRAFT_1777027 [Mycena galopus ATCC 62051]